MIIVSTLILAYFGSLSLADTITSNSTSLDPPSNLKLLFLIHRHGDRTPLGYKVLYPNDPYGSENQWPDGWGQLTIAGKKRMYDLGKYLAQRYQRFLGSTPREVYIRSTAVSRCMESATQLLAGLYPPQGRWKWNDDLGQIWQPFAINTAPLDGDSLLNSSAKCPTAESEFYRVLKSPEMIQYEQDRKDLYKYLKSKAGVQIPFGIAIATGLFDTLSCQNEAYLPSPEWLSENLYQALAEIRHKYLRLTGSTKLLQRLRVGPLFKEILERIKKPGALKVFIYSTHDINIEIFLRALGVRSVHPPPFGATVMLEVSEDNRLQFWYLKDTTSERPMSLILSCSDFSNPRSTSSCSLESFEKFISPLSDITNWEEECNSQQLQPV